MRTTTVIIGAGQAGLAMSWWLAQRGIDHVVLERGAVANTWRKERWDSLTLLTPNWQSRLPGFGYEGDQPDGFRTRDETIAFLDAYARRVAPPLRLHCPVTSVRRGADGYKVESEHGMWTCRAVVIASGAFSLPRVPELAHTLPPDIEQVTLAQYRSPAHLRERGVLVVGAAASGAQLADEIRRTGRDVTLAVGEHVRAPRTYRGRDIQWWMDATGLNDERYDQVENLTRAQSLPSFQIAGYRDRRDIDLNALRTIGVKMVGRLAGVRDGKAQLSGSLRNVCELADLKLNRLLNTFDEWATARGIDGEVGPPHRLAPTQVDASPPLLLDFARSGIRTVVWATGFRPDYSWLDVPVLDRKGNIVHEGGVVTDAPGLYVLGLPFLRRRKSTLIDGVGDDALDLSAHLAAYLGTHPAPAHHTPPFPLSRTPSAA
ncbi:MAG TPA: NAD(P)-binding domain-containing protein [Burkholderiaceae bacterium]|nr:NAD(P)-binding domain-containing protein [Burkholderiaceae bacterium]